MTIRNVHTDQLVKIIAGLVREGLTFRVDHNAPGSDYWTVVLLGGF